MNRPPNHTDAALYDLLARLKRDKVMYADDLTDVEIILADRLVTMKLATKINTRLNSFYYYGIPETEGK